MKKQQKPINVFLSYAPADKGLVRQLEAHLSMLKHEGLISTWCKRELLAGSNWMEALDQRLEQARLILLLVSADFLASDYCYQVEVRRALELHRAGRALVIPVILRQVEWQNAPFAGLSPLPEDGKPVRLWRDRDEALVSIVSGLRARIKEMAGWPPDPAYMAWTNEEPEIATPARRSSVYQTGVRVEYPGQQSTPAEDTASRLAEQRQVAFPLAGDTDKNGDILPPTPFGLPFPEVWNVPRRHTTFFTGREQVLRLLFKRFGTANEAGMISPQAITAPGGMGKTQVAAEYAYRFRGYYKAVLWVNAETTESLLADFRSIAILLKQPQERLRRQESLVQCLREWFMAHAGWLLIFDNVDDPEKVRPFLPQAARGHILATTRAGAVVSWARPLKLDALAVEDGALCILRRGGLLEEDQSLASAPRAMADGARRLADLMDNLPLALEQAGAYINDTECGVNRYLTVYTRYRADIQVNRHGVPMQDYSESVASVWRISRANVEQNSPAAAELLCLCAFLAPEGIPDALVTLGAEALGPVLGPVASKENLLDQIIGVLRRYSLIAREAEREGENTRLSIHRLLQELLLDEMDQARQRVWAERAVRAVELASHRMPWSELRAHARRCQILIETWHMRFSAARRLLQWIAQAEREEQK
ncbi:MAG TPA: toll/interleukin-1 receptor domain-containing protein [Ktedonobacteraceae bacterium]|nr:toll/interleukin-1 receptor domain-containing protein [Ktedonobacteraceae bacterium]